MATKLTEEEKAERKRLAEEAKAQKKAEAEEKKRLEEEAKANQPEPEPDLDLEDAEISFNELELPGKVWADVFDVLNSHRENGINMGIVRERKIGDCNYTCKENRDENGVLLTIERNVSRRPGQQAEFDELKEQQRKLVMERRYLAQKETKTDDQVIRIEELNTEIARAKKAIGDIAASIDGSGGVEILEFLFDDWMVDTYVVTPIAKVGDADISL